MFPSNFDGISSSHPAGIYPHLLSLLPHSVLYRSPLQGTEVFLLLLKCGLFRASVIAYFKGLMFLSSLWFFCRFAVG